MAQKTLAIGALFGLALIVACGSRSALPEGKGKTTSSNPSAAGGNGGQGGTGGAAGGHGGDGGSGGSLACLPEEVLACGSEVGECKPGVRRCIDGIFGACQDSIDPVSEQCNQLDDDCDGSVDEGFGLGMPCDGPDSDLCQDDFMTCNGCSSGENNLELCNGVDDNCNGTIDSDCDSGDCQPSLLVISSTPSSPSCINFPVSKGSKGTIQYPCGGGTVSANLDAVQFSGNVKDNQVLLKGSQQITGPDNCQWLLEHTIEGSLNSGSLGYSYAETLITMNAPCWSPCTEIGTVSVTW